MRIEDVIKQLQAVLPKHTDFFTDTFQVISLTRSGTTITAVTSSPHGLTTGDFAFIDGAKNPIPIINLTRIGDLAYAETSQDHDLTYYAYVNERLRQPEYIDIDGAIETEYNGSKLLKGAPNRLNFIYEVSQTASTPATGSPVLLQRGRGYNGWNQTTVIDPVTFTYETTETPNSPAAGTIVAKVRPRISGGITDQACVDAYTEQIKDNAWAFVIMGDKFANKAREVITDATATQGKGSEYKQVVIQQFSVLVIFPSAKDEKNIAARIDRDNADSLVLPFCKSLLRVEFPTGFSANPFSGVVFITDRFLQYNNGFYVHEYVFETSGYIEYADTIDPEDNVAFRTIELDFETSLSETADVVMTAEIDLDEEQLT